jgi:3-hydroxyacyl-CoA dehydrogenase/3-hydroxy-2-methylbutyryl-CoA dehydrogenase
MSLARRVALVTGGASGLGRATAEHLAKRGASIIICDLPASDGQNVARAIGPNCHFHPTDVYDTNNSWMVPRHLVLIQKNGL